MHKLLLRQLSRLNITFENPPTAEAWKMFLEKISRVYQEMDQERYMLERAMEISSHEMHELNDMLENAQKTARLGYWYYDRERDHILWSKPLYEMFGFPAYERVPKFETVISYIDPKHRAHIEDLINATFSEGKEFETEVKMRRFDTTNEYRWYYIVGHPHQNSGKSPEAISGIAMDITKRKTIEEEIAKLNSQLVDTARKAGMADVATSILHNVGNILNSANVSIGLVQEYTAEEYLNKMKMVWEMLQAHKDEMHTYLLNDPKGKVIPAYLCDILNIVIINTKKLLTEISNLKIYLDHIKDITTLQETISGLSGMYERLFLPEAIEAAIMIAGQDFKKLNIHLIQKYQDPIFIESDKTKLFQILCNLIKNAKEALLESNLLSKKELAIQTRLKKTEKEVIITVKDNGIGIAPENVNKIFSMGYTTKKFGHGFGLHSSALAAKELGGRLEVESEGLDLGATLILTLPLTQTVGERHEYREKLTNHRD